MQGLGWKWNKKYMNNSKKFYLKKNGGQAMIISVMYFLFLSFSIISGFVSPAVREVKNSNVSLFSKSSYFLAESGVEDVTYRLKNSLTVGSSEVIVLNGSTVTTNTTDLSADVKQIVAFGDLNSYQRKVQTELVSSVGVPFYHAIQVGTEGVSLTSSTIVGNVYANGPITGDTSSTISGTAISAGSSVVFLDQSNDTGIPAYDRSFGNTSTTQDMAQSFIVNSSAPVSKMQLYLKKVIAPADLTVRIVNNVAGMGVPGTTVYATGTLLASSVSASYSWVDVTFTTNPTLSLGTTYWLVVDSSITNISRYYVAGASDELSSPFPSGVGLTGQYGGAWANPYPDAYDHFFKLYLGGVGGRIAGSSGSPFNPLRIGTISGTAQANTVNYVNSSGLIYCQNGTGNNKPCTVQADPPYLDYPIADTTITQWKDEAVAGGNVAGNYSLPNGSATIGPTKISGNLTVSGGAVLTVAGTLWVTGNISLTGGSQIRLSASYGASDGVIVNDGTITIGTGSDATGSGDVNSYLMLLTTSSSASAVSLSGGSGAVILYAANGTVNISGGASLKSITANGLVVSGNSTVTYNSGLQNSSFSSGPGASGFKPSVSVWKEIQ